MRLKTPLIITLLGGFALPLSAATVSERIDQQAIEISKLKQQLAGLTVQAPSNELLENKFSFSSYGSVNYASREVFQNTQDVNPTRRASVDVERLVAEFGYQFDPKWSIEFEVEFEHGGTGITLEYDGFEEFGEFETELEAGGEVIVEKLEVTYQHSKQFGLKMGHIYVPVGMSTSLHKPHQYFTVTRHSSLNNMIPGVWHETGIAAFGQIADFHYQAQVVTGLNSEYFRTYNWVNGASQKRFETANADDLALVVRLDYGDIKQGSAIGFSYYVGNTSGNRHKTNQMNVDGQLSILDLHGVYRGDKLTVRAQYLLGDLQDSNAITAANRNTPGLKVGNFAQLGSQAEAMFIEAGYDISSLVNLKQPLSVFTSVDYSNPLSKVDNPFASKRHEKTEFAIGINYMPTKNLVFKAQVGQQQSAMSAIPNTNSFEMGLGYYFSL